MWRQDESGRVHTPLEPVVLVATLALIPVLIIESDAKSAGWLRFAEIANWLIWAVFAIELAAILIVASRRKAALRAHWLDVVIVVLTVPLVTEALAWLRLARFIRLARLGALTTRALQAERRVTSGDTLRIAAILTLTAIVVGGAAEYAVSTGEFTSLWDGVWWAVVTVTTVGYGDLYPKSIEGRLIGMVLMFVGIGFLSLLTAAVASRFVRQDTEGELVDVMEALRRIEIELADVKSRLGDGSSRVRPREALGRARRYACAEPAAQRASRLCLRIYGADLLRVVISCSRSLTSSKRRWCS